MARQKGRKKMDTKKPTADPAADPKVVDGLVAALTAQMIDVRLDTPITDINQVPELCVKRETIVRDGSGLWSIIRTPFGSVTRKAPALTGPKVLAEGFYFDCPKIPWKIYGQIVMFFREAYKTYKSEAYAEIWLDDKGEYYVRVPPQDITAGNVKYREDVKPYDPPGHLWVVGIHSHHTMTAYFSNVDDTDEKKHERIFAVVGKIDTVIPESKWRMSCGGSFILLDFEKVVEIPEEEQVVKFSLRELLKGNITFNKPLSPFEGCTFPKDWMDQLEERKFTNVPAKQGHHHYTPYGMGGHSSHAHHTSIRSASAKDDADDVIEIDGTIYYMDGGKLYERYYDHGIMREREVKLHSGKKDRKGGHDHVN